MALMINNIPKQVAKNTSDIAYLKRRVDEGVHAKYFHTIRIASRIDSEFMFTVLSDRSEPYSKTTLIEDMDEGLIPSRLPVSGLDSSESTASVLLYNDDGVLTVIQSDEREKSIMSGLYDVSDFIQTL